MLGMQTAASPGNHYSACVWLWWFCDGSLFFCLFSQGSRVFSKKPAECPGKHFFTTLGLGPFNPFLPQLKTNCPEIGSTESHFFSCFSPQKKFGASLFNVSTSWDVQQICGVHSFNLEEILPSRKLAYPHPRYIWRWFSFSRLVRYVIVPSRVHQRCESPPTSRGKMISFAPLRLWERSDYLSQVFF